MATHRSHDSCMDLNAPTPSGPCHAPKRFSNETWLNRPATEQL